MIFETDVEKTLFSRIAGQMIRYLEKKWCLEGAEEPIKVRLEQDVQKRTFLKNNGSLVRPHCWS